MAQQMNYNNANANTIINWFFGVIIFAIGVLNLLFVHPVPGLVALFLSTLYLPVVNSFLLKTFGFQIPLYAKIILGILVIWFTLGVSDLGDMIDKL